MRRRPPGSKPLHSSGGSGVYKGQNIGPETIPGSRRCVVTLGASPTPWEKTSASAELSPSRRNGRRSPLSRPLIHIPEPTRPFYISYAAFAWKKKNSFSSHVILTHIYLFALLSLPVLFKRSILFQEKMAGAGRRKLIRFNEIKSRVCIGVIHCCPFPLLFERRSRD